MQITHKKPKKTALWSIVNIYFNVFLLV